MARQQGELMAQRQRVEDSHAAAAQLIAEYADLHPRASSPVSSSASGPTRSASDCCASPGTSPPKSCPPPRGCAASGSDVCLSSAGCAAPAVLARLRGAACVGAAVPRCPRPGPERWSGSGSGSCGLAVADRFDDPPHRFRSGRSLAGCAVCGVHRSAGALTRSVLVKDGAACPAGGAVAAPGS